jgi:hypothetical protein
MRIVIQCAGSKRAGTLRAADGRRVAFVADPSLAPPISGVLHAHPDHIIAEDGAASGQTWRDRVTAANGDGADNPLGLLPAARLHAPEAHCLLERTLRPERLFILSAGWGLVRADFLLPTRLRHHLLRGRGALEPAPPRARLP